MLTFKKYNSIENHYREKFINLIYEYGYGEEIYVVQEKIDGANFSFISDGKEVKVASRNQFVDNTFFNCQSVIDKYSQEVINIFSTLKNNYDDEILSIQLYGELFGDSIQNRVKYCKHKDFLPFDLLVNHLDKNFFIVNYDYFLYFHNYIHKFYMINLYEGNLEECLDYCKNNLNKNSFIAQNYFTDYSNLENNISEGFVIKPLYKNLYFNNGERVILKYKNTKFLERENLKFKEKKDISLTDKENEILNNLILYINENRLNSVISKIGKISDKDFGKVLGMISQDILIDFNKDFEDIKVNKNINKQFMNECSKFIRTKFVNLIDK